MFARPNLRFRRDPDCRNNNRHDDRQRLNRRCSIAGPLPYGTIIVPITPELSTPPNSRVVVFVTNLESTTVNAIEQARFDPLYDRMLQALKLQGKRPETIKPTPARCAVSRSFTIVAPTRSTPQT